MTPLAERLKVPFLVILFFFFCLFLFVKLFGPLPFDISSVTNQANLFTVQGTGEVTAVPQTAMVSFGINASANTLPTAQNQVNKTANTIVEELKKIGIKDTAIKTTNYSAYPTVYPFIRPPVEANTQASTTTPVQNNVILPYPLSPTPAVNGYTVSEDIQVTLQNTTDANKVIDIATSHGATNISGVQFILTDDQQKQLEEQARNLAISDAKQKAQSIAQAAGIHLGRIVNIDISDNGYPVPLYYQGKDLINGGAKPSTNIQPGQNKITVTVTLSYQTY